MRLIEEFQVRDQPFLDVLDDVLELTFDDKYLDASRWNADLVTPTHMEDRTNLGALMAIRTGLVHWAPCDVPGDRWRALTDVNKLKIQIDEETTETLKARAKEAFVAAGAMDECDELIKSGNGLYPKYGYMGWHTNSCTPGTRLYCNYASENFESGLRYYFEGDQIGCRDMLDRKGWNFRMFDTDDDPLFWHAVWSRCHRVSIGFRVLKGGVDGNS